MVNANPIQLSVVVAVRNAGDALNAALTSIDGSDLPREIFEIIVVDDASDDASASLASRYADAVIRLAGKAAGPAYARNRGAELARGSFIAFVDADVVVRQDTLRRMLVALNGDNSLDVVSARYAGTPADRGLVSEYWNLLLTYGDERAPRSAAYLAGGCVMMRRALFDSTGMFDEWRFRAPYLEDVEFGQRLADRGSRVGTLPGLEVTHLRRTTARRMLHDVWQRSELLARSLGYRRTRASAPNDVVFALNGAAIPAVVMSAAVLLSAASGPGRHWSENLAVALIIAGLMNLPACIFFSRRRGPALALLLLPLHMIAQATAVAALTVGWLLRDTIGDRIPDATMQAFAEVGVEMWPPVPKRN